MTPHKGTPLTARSRVSTARSHASTSRDVLAMLPTPAGGPDRVIGRLHFPGGVALLMAASAAAASAVPVEDSPVACSVIVCTGLAR